LLTCLLAPGYLLAQNVTVAGSTGADGSYATLKAAFDAINAQPAQAGNNIVVTIGANTTETATAALNQPTTSSWATLAVRPSGNFSVTGSIAGPLVQLNGADNVTIEVLGGNSLLMANNSVSATTVVELVNDATNNTLSRLSLRSSTTATGASVVSVGGGTTTGNDNNTFIMCSLSGLSATRLAGGLTSVGTSTTVVNNNCTVQGCTFENVFSLADHFSAIWLGANNSGWSILNNRVYQTSTRTLTSNVVIRGIYIGNGGTGYTVSNNQIGPLPTPLTGTTTFAISPSTLAPRYSGIELNLTSLGGTNTVSGNTVASTSFTTASTGSLIAIWLDGTANYQVENNTIGATTGTGSITNNVTGTSGGLVGLYINSPGSHTVQSNTFGALSALASGTANTNVMGIAVAVSVAGSTFSNNTVGNADASNLLASSTTGSTQAAGIYFIANAVAGALVTVSNNTFRHLTSTGTGASGYARGITTNTVSSGTHRFVFEGNLIHNLTSNSSMASLANALTTVAGIHLAAGVGTNTVARGNTIHTLSAGNPGTGATHVAGIALATATNTTVERNRIYNLANASTATSTTAPATASGILVRSGATAVNIHNNMVALGQGQATNTAFIGIWGNHASAPNPTANIFHNSVTIGGANTVGNQPSFAYLRGDLSTTTRTVTVNLRNNILANTRTGGTGGHYAIANNYNVAPPPATGWTAAAVNRNLLNAATATVGHWGSARDLAGWRTASGADANSQSGVGVTWADEAIADLHLAFFPFEVEAGGLGVAAVATDFDGEARHLAAPSLGADESPFQSTWDGTTWIPSAPTVFGSRATIASTTPNQPGSFGTGSLSISPGANLIIAAGESVTMNGALGYAGNLTVQSGGFFYNLGTVLGTTTGTFRAEVGINKAGPGYNYIGSPVAGATFNTIGTTPYASARYRHDPTRAAGARWVAMAGTDALQPGTGYTFVSNTGASTLAFAGTPRSGPVSVPLTGQTGYRYHLVANPYTTPVSLPYLFATNNDPSTGISGTAWLWQDNNNNTGMGSYVALNWVSNPTAEVAVGQGFMVQANTNSGTLNFNDLMRTTGTPAFYRGEGDMERFKLEVTAPTGRDELWVAFGPQFTTGLEHGFDAEKLEGAPTVSLSAMVGGERLAIAALPGVERGFELPLQLFARSAGSYTFAAGEVESPTGEKLFLEDRQTGEFYYLQPGRAHTLSVPAGTHRGRYFLRAASEVAGQAAQSGTGPQAYSFGRELFVAADGLAEVRVYDLLGTEVARFAGVQPGGPRRLAVGVPAAGVYVVRVATATGTVERRVWLEK
jgi:hypothetical protein